MQLGKTGQTINRFGHKKAKPTHLHHRWPIWAFASGPVARKLVFVSVYDDFSSRIGTRYFARATLSRIYHYQRRKLSQIKKRELQANSYTYNSRLIYQPGGWLLAQPGRDDSAPWNPAASSPLCPRVLLLLRPKNTICQLLLQLSKYLNRGSKREFSEEI